MLHDVNLNSGDFAEHVTFPVTNAFEMTVALGSLAVSAIAFMYPDIATKEEEEELIDYDEQD